MVVNPERNSKFGAWQTVSNFDSNGATWTAPTDGFLIVRFGASVTDVYIYIGVAGRVLASISNKGATGGYTYTTMVAVSAGETYTMTTNQTSGIAPFFKSICS